MRFIRPLLAAAGGRAHQARQDLKEPVDDSGRPTSPRRPAVRWRARAAVAVTALTVPLLAAGAAPALAASSPAGAAATDEAHIYWTSNAPRSTAGTIGRATVDATKVDSSFIPGASSTAGVAVDAGYVYWSNLGTGTIGRANLDGTGADQNFITGLVSPTGVAVDAGHVYWANYTTGTIGRANLDGTGADSNFITGAASP